jgi:hypothetical protein
MQVLVYASAGDEPLFNVWALDSGRYASDSIAGQSIEADGLRSYDWIRPSQLSWYAQTSEELERRFGTSGIAEKASRKK